MLQNKKGDVISYLNHKQRRKAKMNQRHNAYSKQYHSRKSQLRSFTWLCELRSS